MHILLDSGALLTFPRNLPKQRNLPYLIFFREDPSNFREINIYCNPYQTIKIQGTSLVQQFKS